MRSQRRTQIDFWPGFVDAMATLLLVIIFLLAIFIIGQFFLTHLISGRDATIHQLRTQINELAETLSLEKQSKAQLDLKIDHLLADLTQARNKAQAQEKQEALLKNAVEEAQKQNETMDDKINLLNQQIASLRAQLAALSQALNLSQTKQKSDQVKIKDLGDKLNKALARKVQELARYRSDFLAQLRNLLKDKADFEIVGDRFILQSEVLFASGSAAINPKGRLELRKVAEVMKEIGAKIPPKVNWVLRVDGHTDSQAIKTKTFPSNWHLSVARAVAVLDFLIQQGLEPKRLVAAGFGEHHPLKSKKPSQWKRNRRIEFKLTER